MTYEILNGSYAVLQVSVRLHDELEVIEEKRARYEEELDRVNDMLTDSENTRLSLQREIDSLNRQVTSRNNQIKPNIHATLLQAILIVFSLTNLEKVLPVFQHIVARKERYKHHA